MSTQSEGEPSSEPTQEEKPEATEEEKPVGKIYYCEICQVPCMSSMTLQVHFAGIRHKKRERALKAPRDPIYVFEESEAEKKPLPTNMKTLKDYVKSPDRGEPLVGMEYVIEIRYKWRKEPTYECELCEFSTDMTPMIEHITGQRHRKLYIRKHYGFKIKRIPNEDKAKYLRRAAKQIESEIGVKNYKCEGFERHSVPSATAKRKGKGLYQHHKNNPTQKRNALGYMNTFEITSDAEATLIVNLAQYLSESLKAFCEKRAAIVHMRSLPPLMKQGRKNTNQAPKFEPPQASKYEPPKLFENYPQGDMNLGQEDMNLGQEDMNLGQEDTNWNLGQLSSGVAQLKSLLQQTSSTSNTPSKSYGQMSRRVPSSGISSKDRATMSALQSSFALQPGGVGCGIEWMKQFNQSASAYCPSTSAGGRSPYFTPPQGNYPQPQQGSTTKVPNTKMPNDGIKPWDSMRDSLDSKAYPLTPVSYPLPRGYQANYPPQRFPSWCGGPMSSNEVPASFSSERNSPGWPQQQSGFPQPNFRGDVRSYPSFSGNQSYPNYQPQNTQLDNVISGSNSVLTADIMSKLRGKDAATLTAMLQQLIPHYPDLQKINIHALAQALSEMS